MQSLTPRQALKRKIHTEYLKLCEAQQKAELRYRKGVLGKPGERWRVPIGFFDGIR